MPKFERKIIGNDAKVSEMEKIKQIILFIIILRNVDLKKLCEMITLGQGK